MNKVVLALFLIAALGFSLWPGEAPVAASSGINRALAYFARPATSASFFPLLPRNFLAPAGGECKKLLARKAKLYPLLRLNLRIRRYSLGFAWRF